MLSCCSESPLGSTLDGSMDTFRETLLAFTFPVVLAPLDDDVVVVVLSTLLPVFSAAAADDDDDDDDDEATSSDCHTEVLNFVSSVATQQTTRLRTCES